MDVPVVGYYGYNNCGDEAFRLAFDGAFLPAHQPRYMDKVRDPLPLAVLGGGAIATGYFLKHLHRVARTHLIGVSLPYGNDDIVALRKLIAERRIAGIHLRSKADVALARLKGIEADFIPDIVLSVPERAPTGPDALIATAALAPEIFESGRRKLFVFLSDHYSIADPAAKPEKAMELARMQQCLAACLDELAADFDIVMPSLSVWHNARDYAFAARVTARMLRPERVCVVERYWPPEALMAVLAGTDCTVLSMKYHGLIFGLKAGRHVVNLGWTRKNLALMADIGLPELSIDLRREPVAALLDAVARGDAPEHLARMAGISAALVDEARRTLQTACGAVVADLAT